MRYLFHDVVEAESAPVEVEALAVEEMVEIAESDELVIAEAEDTLVAETVNIFIEEAEEHLHTIDLFLQTETTKSQDYNGLIRALHTLRGSSSMAQIDEIFDASSKVENLFKTLLQEEIVSSSKEATLLIQYAEFVRDYLHVLRSGNSSNLQ